MSPPLEMELNHLPTATGLVGRETRIRTPMLWTPELYWFCPWKHLLFFVDLTTAVRSQPWGTSGSARLGRLGRHQPGSQLLCGRNLGASLSVLAWLVICACLHVCHLFISWDRILLQGQEACVFSWTTLHFWHRAWCLFYTERSVDIEWVDEWISVPVSTHLRPVTGDRSDVETQFLSLWFN